MAHTGDRLRVAVVGASASGRGWAPVAHLPAIAAVDQFELVAVGASSPESAAAASEAYGVAHGFHDVGDLGAAPDVEVVVVAVKVPHHHDIVIPLLEAGMHVYCEWPLGATTAEAEAMAAGHTLDTVEHCFGTFVDVSAMVGVQVPQWHLADTGDIVDVDAPDTIVVHGTLASGSLVSYLAALVPHHGPRWRMGAYGTDATLVASSAALPQITPITLTGAQGDKPLAPVPVPKADRAAVSDGPGRNIARSSRRMAEAIRGSTAATPDFDHALRVHRLLDVLQESSDQRHTTGAPS